MKTPTKVWTVSLQTDEHNEINSKQDIDIDKVIGTVWINDALNKEKSCVVLVDKMTADHIYSLKPKPDIDPYSYLEDIGNRFKYCAIRSRY